MSFGVALNRCSAFKDWETRGRPADAMFKYMKYHNQGNEVLVYIFSPGQGMLYMDLYVDFEIVWWAGLGRGRGLWRAFFSLEQCRKRQMNRKRDFAFLKVGFSKNQIIAGPCNWVGCSGL